MMEATNRLGHRDIKGSKRDCFIFYSWFSLKGLEEAVMYVGSDISGMFETNTKVLCKGLNGRFLPCVE